LNLIKKIAQQQKQAELTQKLFEAKRRLSLSKQNNASEQEKLSKNTKKENKRQ
jgi:hypothetical protein